MNNATESQSPQSCPLWCTVDHDAEGHYSFHSTTPVDLDKPEADGGRFYAYLVAENHNPEPVVALEGPGQRMTLTPSSVELLLAVMSPDDEDARDRARLALSALLRKAARPTQWWQSAANPACPDWCVTEHAGDELATGGAIVHDSAEERAGDLVLKRAAIVGPLEEPGAFTTSYDEVELSLEGDDVDLQLTSRDGSGARLAVVLPIARALVERYGATS